MVHIKAYLHFILLKSCLNFILFLHIYIRTHIHKYLKESLDKARASVRDVVNASLDSEIYFTSCGSESDNR
jgi:hypothetical protein